MEHNNALTTSLFSDFDNYLFGEGKHLHVYEKLGAHPRSIDGVKGVYFSVWAPNAQHVSLTGDFNHWNADQTPMHRNSMGIWEAFIPGLGVGEKYKYAVRNHKGKVVFKTDPYGYKQEVRPKTASVVADLAYTWHDQEWLEKRRNTDPLPKPVSVYEVHAGSWLHANLEEPPEQGEAVIAPHKTGARFLTYRELADKLIPYLLEMGYTHVELLPIAEHPFDGSWGYQVVGYYAPTSRYGEPQDFMYFVDKCHENNIGVILDWVPGHFPKDEHGLVWFDGTPLYEYEDPRKGEHKGWGTLVFNYGRHEVRNFLIANAIYWFEKYHIDGIRVDAVASMLYLDYEREPNQWIPNQHGGRENLEAIVFLRQLNEVIFANYPGILSIAEEGTTWPNVSRPTDMGGLGFNFKWNMGWMNDTLSYFLINSHDRSNYHGKIIFSIWYAFTENYVLSLSHDEVVHGKGHLYQKMPGDDWHKLANLRLLFAYMFTHPGKKTMFMGMEFGQTHEWNCNFDINWWLLQQERHKKLQELIKYLNQIYRNESALYSDDFSHNGFQWIDCHDVARGIISYIRKDKNSDECIITICNFKPHTYHHYWLAVLHPGTYRELINTDAIEYGGSGITNGPTIEARQWNSQPWPYALEITIPPVSALSFQLIKS